MANFNFTDSPKIDGVHWPLALYFNEYEAALKKLASGALVADFVNNETITATRALVDADMPIQRLTPSGASRQVNLPAVDVGNHPFFLVNAGASNNLWIGGLAVLSPGESALFVSDGTAWRVVADRIPLDTISGLQLQWVSGTALTIGTGFAVLPNGARVNVSAPIAKSGLSLVANTWYHVYLYLNGATPDIEIVTNAPAAPYLGTARAKTGDTSRRYVGSVRTNAAANLRNFYQQNDIVLFRENFDQNRVVSGGTAIVETTASCQALVPPFSRVAILRIANSATTGTLATGTSDDSVSAPGGGTGITVTGANTVQVTPHSLNENQEFTWWYSTTPSGGVAFVDVYGYYVAR